jgi:HSP20 family protein
MSKRHLLPTLWGKDDNSILGFDAMRRRMERFFDSYPWEGQMPDVMANMGRFDLVPDMDVKDSDKELTLTMELPGVDEKDVDITVTDQSLTISGEKKAESSKTEGDFFRSERSFGSFSRSMLLPFRPDADKVEAKYNKGVLTIRVPKPAEAIQSSRKIAISA